MKILYAIQGTGNGHLSRARDIIPILQKKGELDILVSGIQADVELPYEVKYRFYGLSFIFGKSGGVDFLATYQKSNLKRLLKEINSLPVEEYDLILNDFEPVSAWACKMRNVPCIGLSHQQAVINKKSPKPNEKDPAGKAILNHYAPVSEAYGFHFERYDEGIYTPVIRSEIRNANATDEGHYTVYLPAYSDEKLIEIFSQIVDVKWEIFSKHSKTEYVVGNVHIRPVNNELFIKSFISSTGVLCGAGFETPAEALYLKKKLLVVPMKGQYEQKCNAAAAARLGVHVIEKLKSKTKYVEAIRRWTKSEKSINVDFPDETEAILDHIISEHQDQFVKELIPEPEELSFRSLRKALLTKLVKKIGQ